MAIEKNKTEYTHFGVRVFAHNTFARSACVLCDSAIEKDDVAAVLEGYTEDREEKTDFGDICRGCLDAGREGAAERMRHQVVHLREHAKWLWQLEDKVVRAETWASSADLDSARRELDKKMGWDKEEGHCDL